MRLSLRAKLLLSAANVALAFLIILAASSIMASRVDARLAAIRDTHIPHLELGPKLSADYDALRRGFQDAVAANDVDTLEKTREARDHLLEKIDKGQELLGVAQANELRAALTDYYDAAFALSRRMIAREGGEDVVEAMSRMQDKQARATALVERAATPDTHELAAAFASARDAQESARRIRLAVTLVALVLVLGFSLWVVRRIVRSVDVLQAGFERYGRGAFQQPIPATRENELADLASAANRMAENLARLGAERDRTQWVAAGLVELSNELGGDLEEAALAARATKQLARYMGAPASALYRTEDDGAIALLGHCGAAETAASVGTKFRRGEGLVGQAATGEDIVVIDDVPEDFWRIRSGLGEALPKSVVLAPVAHHGRSIGVLEIASFKGWGAQENELLLKARESLAVALDAARSRTETRMLLERAQELAARLTTQEETLRTTNQELQAQQEELRQTNEELSQQAEELEVQRSALEERNTALQAARGKLETQARELTVVSAYKSQFLANMSHELRTPLNSMLLLSNLLSENTERNLTDKQVDYAKTIHSAGRDLLGLINQVLDLAKVEAGKQEVRAGEVVLGELADRLRRVFMPLAKDRGLELRFAIADDSPQAVRTDERLLVQVLNNLLGNAIKFTDRGSVALRIGPARAGVRFRSGLTSDRALAFAVADTGPGIAVEDQERVFLPFEQVDGTGQRKHGGTGLGLNIAREVATLLGGELHLESTLGKGTTFTLYLPRDAIHAAATKAPPRLREERRAAAPPPSGTEILLIEDDPVFTEVVHEAVSARGLTFVSAPDGATGLRLARERQPRGIILDVKLPDIDGLQVMERLRDDPRTANIPVHVVSAMGLADRARTLGATGYLTKPATRQELAEVVASLAPSGGQGATKILVVEDDLEAGDSVLRQLADENIDARRVTTAREALELTQRERFACLILDLSLPDMSGLELLEQLRERSASEMPAVVIYTGRALSKAETTKLETYAEAVVLKDGSSSERLLHEVRLFVRRLQSGARPRRSAVPSISDDVRFEGRRILVADDDMRTVYALSATLRAKGAEVLVAENGAVALKMLAEHPDVSAVLMDVMMPEMDGYEAMRRIREQPRFLRLPIVALTAKAMKGDAERCLAAGASDYLPKPVDADKLLALLHARFSKGDG